MKDTYKRITEKLGKKLSDSLSTMEMFYIVTFLVLFPLFFQRPDTLISWIQYISTAMLQAIALPLLGYTTKKSGESQEKVIIETHKILIDELKEARKHSEEQMEILREIKEIHKVLMEHDIKDKDI